MASGSRIGTMNPSIPSRTAEPAFRVVITGRPAPIASKFVLALPSVMLGRTNTVEAEKKRLAPSRTCPKKRIEGSSRQVARNGTISSWTAPTTHSSPPGRPSPVHACNRSRNPFRRQTVPTYRTRNRSSFGSAGGGNCLRSTARGRMTIFPGGNPCSMNDRRPNSDCTTTRSARENSIGAMTASRCAQSIPLSHRFPSSRGRGTPHRSYSSLRRRQAVAGWGAGRSTIVFAPTRFASSREWRHSVVQLWKMSHPCRRMWRAARRSSAILFRV